MEMPVLPSDRSLGEKSALGVPFGAEATLQGFAGIYASVAFKGKFGP